MRRPKIAAHLKPPVRITSALRRLFVIALLQAFVLFGPGLSSPASGGLVVEKIESANPKSIGDVGFSRPRIGETNLPGDEPVIVEPWPEDAADLIVGADEESLWNSEAMMFPTAISTTITIWAEELGDASNIQLIEDVMLLDMSDFAGFFAFNELGLTWDSEIDEIEIYNTGFGVKLPVPDIRKYKLFAVGLMIVSYFAWRRIEHMS